MKLKLNVIKYFVLTFIIFNFCSLYAADRVTITVANSLTTPRSTELAEVDASLIQARLDGITTFFITDADGKEVPSQITYDGKLIFPVGVPAKGKSIYYAQKGQPSVYEPKVFGRQFPERVDDMAWENDKVAFRCYGPALQRSGERAWGYDVWNKRTSRLIVEARYASELDPDMQRAIQKLRNIGQGNLADDLYNAISYHVDHGDGMDCYKVGSTLGCGTAALYVNERIQYPRCYTTYEILDRGPLRFTVKLAYGTENIDGMAVFETRIISLDAGSHLNKAVISYSGLKQETPLAVGIVVHNENPNAYVQNNTGGYMCYEDLGDPNQYKEKYRAKQNADFGHIYVGTVFPQTTKEMKYQSENGLPGAYGHILAISSVNNASPFTYYFGSAWDRNEETGIFSLTDWEAYLSNFVRQVRNPLKVTIKS
ncbi:MAG: DUF4861 domain-containing protein [Bacteroidaceae bacterium]|nr:DUF4861 domain-containing protein [Bacteroidaceae bacterium]